MSGTSLCEVCVRLNISREKFMVQEPEIAESSIVFSNPHLSDLEPVDLGFLDSIYSRRQYCQFCLLIYQATRSGSQAYVGHDGLDSSGARISCKLEWHLDTRNTKASVKTRRIVVLTSCTMIPSIHVIPLATPEDRAIGFGTHIVERADFQRLHQWFQACTKHDQCTTKDGRESSLWPARLLTIGEQTVKVVSSSEGMEYATLSYVWGNRLPLRLTQSSYTELTIAGFPLDGLPPTIRGACSVARSLGIQFIWVDALCIVQDNEDDMRREVDKMHGIFSKATITICAASGAAYDGIMGVGDIVRPKRENLFEINQQRVTALHTVSHLISTTLWDSRGWTFQERLLSRRCIIFTPTEMIWQCQDATWRESILLGLSEKSWTLDSINTPYVAAEGNPVRHYTSCVEIYSGRLLTLDKDKLPAFEGLGQKFAASLGSNMLFGLPARYFDWAMLWDSKEGGPRLPHFPSWSWCGWHRKVEWRVSMLRGVLFDLNEWLRTRTWVIWWYADCGKWKLVWDVENQSSTSTGDGRWNGYSGGPEPYGRDTRQVLHNMHGFLGLGEPGTATGYPVDGSLIPPSGQNQLSFATFTGTFALSRHTLSTAMFPSNQEGLHRFGITDKAEVGGLFEFAAISSARDYSMEELDSWNYYIPQDRVQADWYCFYAIMMKPVGSGTGIYERIGLAKIFRSAFSTGSFRRPGWKQIILQ
ncbi:HET-domain-containing protein [Aspergillus campestris IBT 28561]|uniref:HET-domain-containing protein n=1 Tax=Aspergillus campestris (strain IBT 28561) TaxID=1392248 RepID=A0A2I1CSP2_ASPC2|nr:HET-domain-containing protein [Aspergillus campestris IBT 28561]PKY00643.1 HET-domain-containing protein [Aspergillus campestris IBT 28561]